MKRAAIYIRTSSERQAEKASPQAQEQDSRDYCKGKGYKVVEVYRDLERYRVGRRLVEPSGTRNDRPAYKRMLADASAGRFDVIIAWREDRLYRGIRPMLDVIDCIEENDIDIELVKENFDRNMAPIKASIARMELQAKEERTKMGMFGRLEQGKVWANLPYGYKKVGDNAEIDPEEAPIVQKIFTWYADGIGTREIRRMLVSENAPQRTRNKGGVPWRLSVIYKILNNDSYYTGIQTITWDNQTFEIPLPVLIEPELGRRAMSMKQKNKSHPARNLKNDYLGMAFAYCQFCGVKLQPRAQLKRGNGKLRKTPYVVYFCGRYTHGYIDNHDTECCKSIGAAKLDRLLWEKVWSFISDPDLFERLLQERINLLQNEEADAGAGCERIERQIDDLKMERQKVITWARKGIISDEDLEMQLMGLTLQENALTRELNDKRLLAGGRAEKLIELARVFREQARKGLEIINTEPDSPELEKEIFTFKRRIVEAIVTRVEVNKEKEVTVYFEFDFSDVVNIKSTPSWEHGTDIYRVQLVL